MSAVENKIKIGGLTWWRNNYGSILQAYALQQVLNDYPGIDYEIINQYGEKIISGDSFIRNLKEKGLKVTLRKCIYRFGIPGLRRRTNSLQKFIDNNLIVSKNQYNQDSIEKANDVYDGFVCGSDQIWNPSLESLTSIYWLGFAGTEKLKFSYAPSIGVSDFSDEYKIKIKENLSTFKAVSCREGCGSDLLNSFSDNYCYTVLDPTMVIDRNIWDKNTNNRIIDYPYIFVYILRGNKEQRKFIEKYAASKGLKIVTIPFLEQESIILYDAVFGDKKIWDASPVDFINLIRYSEQVFTDSFHCMIFSLLYHKSFCCFPKKGKNQMNRINDLHDMFGLEYRILNDSDEISQVDNLPRIDWQNVDSILKEKREASYAYLNSVLCNAKN